MTEIMIRNINTRDGWSSMFLHWFMVIAVIVLFISGQYSVNLGYYDFWCHQAAKVYESIAALLLMTVIFRFFWNSFQVRPVPISTDTKSELTASVTLNRFILLLVMLFISDYMMITDLTGDIDEIIVAGFFILLATHALVAFYSYLIIYDFYPLAHVRGSYQQRRH